MAEHDNEFFDEIIDAVTREKITALESSRVARLEDRVSKRALANELAVHLTRKLRAQIEDLDASGQVALVDDLLAVLARHARRGSNTIERPVTRLEWGGEVEPPALPRTPLSMNQLVTNGRSSENMTAALRAEFPTAHEVDLICAFIKWPGVRLLQDVIEAHIARGRRLRVITTTYMGTSDPRAVSWLHDAGVDVKVCYEQRSTRLHAKAWRFERVGEATTVFVGSSNLSHSALHDGLEWNVRLSERRAAEIVARFQEVFERYWSDPLFEDFDDLKFRRAIAAARGPALPLMTPAPAVATGHAMASDAASAGEALAPYPYQAEILEALRVERERHDRHNNLVVAATGTGKTMIAAFDWAQLVAANPDAELTLLFVAHRKDILEQSLSTFRRVLGDSEFGELFVGGEVPTAWTHVFASIQSLTRRGVDAIDPTRFDVVIVDEVHHASAATYEALLGHVQPGELLGLTATPERTDGRSILPWFDGQSVVELRLWDALEHQLLVPFQYFGCDDGTDMTALKFSRTSGYTIEQMDELYTANDARARLILDEVERVVLDPKVMRAIGFCVSIAHAEYMARVFNDAGYAAIALSSQSADRTLRDRAPQLLADGELQIIFTVDLYNEGVDIPCVDTLLMLRPTQSATVFLQQLGRGLRHSPGKACLTVLDFVGAMHQDFALGERYAALTGMSAKQLEGALEDGSLFLPSGCHIQLDKITSARVLEHIRSSLNQSVSVVARQLASSGATDLLSFIAHTGYSCLDVYKTGAWCWTKLAKKAGLLESSPYEDALFSAYAKRFFRLAHIEDSTRLTYYRDLLSRGDVDLSVATPAERRMILMLHNQLWGAKSIDGVAALTPEVVVSHWRDDAMIRAELTQLFTALEETAQTITTPMGELDSDWPDELPLDLHGAYTREEILTAMGRVGIGESSGTREGVWRDRARKIECMFVTLAKDEDQFSPTVRYHDYPISASRFHWQTQNSASPMTPTGKHYIEHEANGWRMLLFIRRANRDSRDHKGAPFRFLGPVSYVSHTGSKPMSIVWELTHAMTARIFDEAHAAVFDSGASDTSSGRAKVVRA